MRPLVVTGTDTGVGKTVVSAMLALGLDGIYWKPIQSGIADATDTAIVAALTKRDASCFLPERYRLREPLSPHRAAEIDGVTIKQELLKLPEIDLKRPLIIEGAGGVLVPITRKLLQVELFARWNASAILCARTALGTINHTLLSLEALRARGIDVAGIVFVGDAMPDSERTIVAFGGAPRLGRLPFLNPLSAETLSDAFRSGFDIETFRRAYA